MVDFHVVPERTALVKVDLQNFLVENTPDGLTVLERVNRVAAECRKAGVDEVLQRLANLLVPGSQPHRTDRLKRQVGQPNAQPNWSFGARPWRHQPS